MANTPGSPEDTTATRAAARRPGPARSAARSASTRVAGRVPALARPLRHPGQVGPVADQVGRPRRGPRRASGVSHAGPPGRGRPRSRPAAGRARPVAPAPCRAGQQRQREVGHAGRVDLGQRRDPLRRRWRRARRSGPRSSRPVSASAARTSGNGAAELQHGGRVGAGQPGRAAPPAAACRAGRSATSSRWTSGRPSGGGGRGHRGHAGHDLGGEAARQPLVHVHVGAVEERVALAQHHHVAAGVQVGGQPAARPRRRSRRARPA